MNVKRIATIGGAAALAAWLAAAANSGNRDLIEPGVVRTPPIDARGAALAGEITRLHERLRPSVAPRQPSRDLFSFAPRQTPPALAPPQARPALTETIVVRPPPPAVQLSGIAEDVTAGAVVRTAIISASGQLFLVKEGEQVTARYRVVKISSEVVELTDLTEGTTLRLALK